MSDMADQEEVTLREAQMTQRYWRKGPDSIRILDRQAVRRSEESRELLARGELIKAGEAASRAKENREVADHLRRRHARTIRDGHPQVGRRAREDRVEVTYVSTWDLGRVISTPAVVSRASGFLTDVAPTDEDVDALGLLMEEVVILADGREFALAMTADGSSQGGRVPCPSDGGRRPSRERPGHPAALGPVTVRPPDHGRCGCVTVTTGGVAHHERPRSPETGGFTLARAPGSPRPLPV